MALSINPSYQWQGSDGPWSTFDLRVGTPPQLVRVLPSTSGSEVWVVHPSGCTNKSVANCAERRGGLFEYNSSSTFVDLSTDPKEPFFILNFEAEKALGYSGSALVGVDTVAIGGEGDVLPALDNQVVAAYAARFPSMGLLGLKARNATIVNETDQHLSILGALKTKGKVKTEYWSYTAGAPYRPPEGTQYGSLTFGGWDKKRGDLEHGLTVPFGAAQDLLVAVTGITLDTVSGPASVGGLPISMYIDSMVPDIWLPTAACNTFESAFGIVWNDTDSHYRVNDTQHETLKARNPNITLSLAESDEASARTMDIVLPYLAFDLSLDTGGYFALKRAENESQYFLGRTFLQEAYLAVNYDRSEFSLAQASFPSGNNERDVVVYHDPGGSSLSVGAIAGICIGAIVAATILVGRVVWLWRRKKQAKERRWGTVRIPSLGGTTVNDKSEDLRAWLKPLESDSFRSEDVKPELDANATARSVKTPLRHELSAGERTVQTTSKQSLASDESNHAPPVELDGSETVVGRSTPAVSPLQNSEMSLSPLPMGYPSPQIHASSPTRERRSSLGMFKSFFHELQAASGGHGPHGQPGMRPETVAKQPEKASEDSAEGATE